MLHLFNGMMLPLSDDRHVPCVGLFYRLEYTAINFKFVGTAEASEHIFKFLWIM